MRGTVIFAGERGPAPPVLIIHGQVETKLHGGPAGVVGTREIRFSGFVFCLVLPTSRPLFYLGFFFQRPFAEENVI